MIGKIKGKLREVELNTGLVETSGGVFYQVFFTPQFINKTPLGGMVEFYTYLQVKEDALVLFGFESKKETGMFRLLLTVPGVGPKTAFNVISYSAVDELIAAVRSNDSSYFLRIPGLGKKTSLKIILELSPKLAGELDMSKMYLSDDDKLVVDALVALGFKTVEARNALQRIPVGLSVEGKIKSALQVATNPQKKV
ncbi:Holliday junction branch migration protein RuvA [Candidatus Roizmanbacteria bacterium]|nr:Holliday junction branch migration protein RuvA [Candidatus Roizmanbacteria bacterium]